MCATPFRSLYYLASLLLLISFQLPAQHFSFRRLTVENGLSQNAVLSITQDGRGFMWYGTRHGLNRFDGTRFKVYVSIPGDSTSLSGTVISALHTDAAGTLWVGTSLGLCRYNAQTDVFDRLQLPGSNNCYISCIYEDRDGRLLLGTNYGLLRPVSATSNQLEQVFPKIPLLQMRGNMTRCIYRAANGELWAGTNEGLVRVDQKGNYRVYHLPTNKTNLTPDYVTSIGEDTKGRLWLGGFQSGLSLMDSLGQMVTYRPPDGSILNNIRKILSANDGKLWVGTQEGMYIIDPVSLQALVYRHNPEDPSSLSNNSVHCFFEDNCGTMWIGTYHGGVNLLYTKHTPFTIYQGHGSASDLSNNIISAINTDAQHRLWIGTEGGGLNYLHQPSGRIVVYKHVPQDTGSLSSNLVKVVYKDSEGQLWIGTSYGTDLNLYDERTKRFRRFSLSKQERNLINFDEVLAIVETSDKTLWVGAQSGLTTLRKQADGSYTRRTVFSPLNDRLPNKNIRALFEDSQHRLWIGTGAGLCCYDLRTGAFKVYRQQENNIRSLQADAINAITEDRKGTIWIGTYFGGLSRFNAASDSFTSYTDKQGLPNNNVLSVVEDNHGKIWCGTDKGLAKFDPLQGNCVTYTTSDGIAGNKFNANASFKDSTGRLYFGSNNGLIAFYPDSLEMNTWQSPVRFTALKLFGNEVAISSSGKLLRQAIDFQKRIRLSYNQSNFTIEYALLNFIKPEKNKYAYMLEGVETHWNYTNASAVSYNNLSPGSYTLLVKGCNNDGIWTAEAAKLEIIIMPPIWKTWYAYTTYALILLVAIFFFLRFFWLRALFKREQELQHFKLNFFTNISHEIRTRLTLISGPVEKLLQANQPPAQQQQLEHVKSNADRLMHLVGELMDFRKAETNNLPLHVSKENISSFTEHVYNAFADLAQAKNIQSSFTADAPVIEAYFDRRQMEKVIFNLLTNAFKFTPAGGSVEVAVRERRQEVQIEVSDNGKGIAPEHLNKLFVNFFQVDDELSQNTGYGIGLALSKSIVELHKGTLTVTSEGPLAGKAGKTSFIVSLRKGYAHFPETALSAIATDYAAALKPDVLPEPAATEVTVSGHKATVLLVEDNTELRSFIKASLASVFTVVECMNGSEGWAVAVEQMPDLVISDVMMPEMDGFTLCHQLKQDIRTSHIPVILLTAKAGHDNQVEGLSRGADAYITKPFSIQLLELQVRNLINSREAMRLQLGRQLVTAPATTQQTALLPVLNPADEAFIKKALDVVDEYMDDPDFSVSVFATKMAMSAPILYKKVKALTDMTVNDFIKSLRLKKAAELLLQGDKNVSEVAYAVGFSRRKHFSEEFKKVFGKTPSEYIAER